MREDTRAFWEAFVTARDMGAAALIYADYLGDSERPDDRLRAEFIRAQILHVEQSGYSRDPTLGGTEAVKAYHHMQELGKRYHDLGRQPSALDPTKSNYAVWYEEELGPLAAYDRGRYSNYILCDHKYSHDLVSCKFNYGFADSVDLDAAQLVRESDAIGAAINESRALRFHVRPCDKGENTDLKALMKRFPRINRPFGLQLTAIPATPADYGRLVSLPSFAHHLRALEISAYPSDEACEFIASSAHLPDFCSIQLRFLGDATPALGQQLTDNGVRALVDSPALDKIFLDVDSGLAVLGGYGKKSAITKAGRDLISKHNEAVDKQYAGLPDTHIYVDPSMREDKAQVSR